MIITYSHAQFPELIKAGIKIHTFRIDKANRWRPGMKIQHWFGNPRNVKKNPHQFAFGECISIQHIQINPITKHIIIDGWRVPDGRHNAVAINDGFSSLRQFWMWFHEPFEGKIIHFTDFKYEMIQWIEPILKTQ